MNRRKENSARNSFGMYYILVIAAALTAGGGALHAFYKNRQLMVTREIDQVEKRIQAHQLEIEATQMRIDEMLNRYALREQLRGSGSSLKSIPVGLVENVDGRQQARTMAAVAP